MRLVKMTELKEEVAKLKMLVYGLPGSGKTWFAASAVGDERSSPVLYVEYRGQSASLAGMPVLQTVPDHSFVHVRLGTFRDINIVYAYLTSPVGKVPTFDDAFAGRRPKTLVLDSLTEFHRAEVLRHGEIDAGERDGRGLEIPDNLVNPSPYNWGKILNQFMVLGNKKYALDMHVIVTALEKRVFRTPGVGKEPVLESVGVALQGQSAELFPSTALTVMRLEQLPKGTKTKQWGTEESVYNRGTFHQTGKAYGRDHTNAFRTPFYNPTVGRLLDILEARNEPTR